MLAFPILSNLEILTSTLQLDFTIHPTIFNRMDGLSIARRNTTHDFPHKIGCVIDLGLGGRAGANGGRICGEGRR